VESTEFSPRAASVPAALGEPSPGRVQANRIRERLRLIDGMPELQPIAARLRARIETLDAAVAGTA
jgi:hypothetical protein